MSPFLLLSPSQLCSEFTCHSHRLDIVAAVAAAAAAAAAASADCITNIAWREGKKNRKALRLLLVKHCLPHEEGY